MRPSGVLKWGRKWFLFDVGPDFRTQALRFGIDHLAGLVVTHTHYDHIAGIDDLRVFCQKKRLPCLLSQQSYEDLKKRSEYLLGKFDFQILEKDFGEVVFEGQRWRVMSYEQNGMKITGFRIGNFAYVVDLKNYSKWVFEELKGVEVLVLSGLRYTPSPAHLGLEEVAEFAGKVGAKKTWLTHISHELDHSKAKLPPRIRLAYDGLEISINA